MSCDISTGRQSSLLMYLESLRARKILRHVALCCQTVIALMLFPCLFSHLLFVFSLHHAVVYTHPYAGSISSQLEVRFLDSPRPLLAGLTLGDRVSNKSYLSKTIPETRTSAPGFVPRFKVRTRGRPRAIPQQHPGATDMWA